MPIPVTHGSPVYVRLAADWRAGIFAGQWHPGDKLPSETELCRELGVSRGTVVRAIELLVQEGLVVRRQGVGTFVSRPTLSRQPGVLGSFSESVRGQGREPSHKLLKREDLRRAEALQYGCTEAAVLLVRLRFVDEVAWCIHRAVLPVHVANKLPALRPENKGVLQAPDFSLYRAYADAGIAVDHAEEILRARNATAEESRLLKLPAHAALMTLMRKSYDAHDDLLEIVESDYAGESYGYTVSLAVGRSAGPAKRSMASPGWKIVNG